LEGVREGDMREGPSQAFFFPTGIASVVNLRPGTLLSLLPPLLLPPSQPLDEVLFNALFFSLA